MDLPEMVRDEVPALVTVIVTPAEAVPMTGEVRLAVVAENVGLCAPVADRVAVCVVTPAYPTESVPLITPVAVGVTVTFTVQVAEAASVVGQLWLEV
jgi:hypothetical protein